MVESIDVSGEFDTLPVVPLPAEFDGIDVFIVGGYVRDTMRGVEEPSDVDLMVTGVEPSELRFRDGFRAVENETFPVFFDSLGREVALAREEQNNGDGHTDFDVFAVPADVDRLDALERDLVRRDIQCNSMAIDPRTGELFDPHGGRSNLQEGIIKATNPDSFKDDGLRVLRAARFAARLDFKIEEETKNLMEEASLNI
jgi:tRNA nucleotidyltransferase (CCA-adding enzyme)